jgi:DNA-binding beta-propeller fold protein YncE
MKTLFSLFLLSLFVGFSPNRVFSQSSPGYALEKKISVPGNGGYDYISIDPSARRLYISHGTTVNVFDLSTEQLVGSVDHMVGVHGIAIAPELQKGFISDGKGNSVVVFDLKTLQVLKTISISGKDPDAILYDPFSKKVFTFNGDSQDAAVIDAVSMMQTGTVSLGGTPEFGVSDGEGKIYNNLEDKNVLNVIDAKTEKIISSFPLAPCGGPTGLALDKKNQRLFTACRKNKGMTVLDAVTGRIIATVPIGAGVDAVAYDAETGLVYCSNGDGTATIIHQDSPDQYQVVQTLTTQWKAKTMALDPQTKKIFFSAFDMEAGNKTKIPDSFKLLIYKPKS